MPGRNAKITNEIYKLANNLKTEFKEVRKSVKDVTVKVIKLLPMHLREKA